MRTTGWSGFTLLELLAALAVFGLLITGLTIGLRHGMSLVDAQSRTLAARNDFDTADTTLRTLLSRMEPGDANDRGPPLVGAPHRLSFVSSLPEAVGVPTPTADIVLLGADRRAALLWSPHYPRPIRPLPPPGRVDLLQDVDRLDFTYWHLENGWTSEWTAPQLPQLVRIHFVFTEASGRRAPDIVVSPMRDRNQP